MSKTKRSMSKPIHPPMPPISITIKGFDKILTGLNPNFFIFNTRFSLHQFFHQVDASISGCFGAFHKIIQRCADQGDQYWPRTGLADIWALIEALIVEHLLSRTLVKISTGHDFDESIYRKGTRFIPEKSKYALT